MSGKIAGQATTSHFADESDLVVRVLSGDMDAFGQIYRAYRGTVEMVVRDNVHDPQTAADVVQDVFMRALERLPTLRDLTRFRPWLLSIARHAAIDQRRARSGAPVFDTDAGESLPSSEPAPGELAELAELAELVNGCIGGLSKRDATALSLITHLGFTPTDVAGALGVTRGAAKVIAHRARQRLRDALSLQLMARTIGPRCSDFDALYKAGDLVGSARHIRSCPSCGELVESEVKLYDAAESSEQGSPEEA